MKKSVCAVLAATLVVGAATVVCADPVRVIPYPPELDTTSEGASSAPAEINHESSIYFDNEDFFLMESLPHRVILPHYPTYQQSREHTCGPAAALTVLYYYGNQNYDEMSLVKAMKTRGYPIGTSLGNVVDFFRRIGWNTESSLGAESFATYAAFKDFVWQNLCKGHPIMVENVEWGGHWRVIIGYDTMDTESSLDDVLIMADPYDTCDHYKDGYTVNNGAKFFSMWFDHSILPEKERNQPWVVAYPKK